MKTKDNLQRRVDNRTRVVNHLQKECHKIKEEWEVLQNGNGVLDDLDL